MDKLSRADILALTRAEGPAVSIYLPTDSLGQSGEADSRRLGNLIREAQRALEAGGLRGPLAEELLAPARALLSDSLFWAHQSRGLALFLTPAMALRLRLPLPFTELAVCGPRLHIRPLLPLLETGGYYLLAASENGARLFGGSRYGLEELEIEGAPQNARAANQFETHERYLGLHSSAPQRGGRFGAMFYGMGSKADEAKGDIQEYARQLASAVDAELQGEGAPLVLFGVESLCAMLRGQLEYRQLAPDAVYGNPDDLDAAELHARAWPLIEPRLTARAAELLAAYAAAAGTGRSASGVEAALAAAADGQVAALLLASGQAHWTREEMAGGRVELLDRAAAHTLAHGGEVWELPSLPDGSAVCALLRY